MLKFENLKHQLKDFNIEIFCFLVHFGIMVQSIVITQTVEDKICLNIYGYDREFCAGQNGANDNTVDSLVLKRAAVVRGYQSIIGKVPRTLTTLVFGSWVNSYPHHLKTIIFMPCICGIFQVLILIANTINFGLDPLSLLLADIIPWIFGSITNIVIALQTYVVLTNAPKSRVIRFVGLDVSYKMAQILGEYFGSHVLMQRPWFSEQFRNYLGIYIVALTFKISAILWLIFMVPSIRRCNQLRINKNPRLAFIGLPTKDRHSSIDRVNHHVCKILSNIISVKAFKNLARLFIAENKDSKRAVLLMMIGTFLLHEIELSFFENTSFQFTQSAYGWTNLEYSEYDAISKIFSTAAQIISPFILIKHFGISDINLGILAETSCLVQQTVLGIWYETRGYIFATVIGTFSILYNSVSRSLLCNVVNIYNIGGILFITSAVSSLLTIGSDLLLIKLFTATLEGIPGLCNIIFALASLGPISLLIWLKLRKPHLAKKFKRKSFRDSLMRPLDGNEMKTDQRV